MKQYFQLEIGDLFYHETTFAAGNGDLFYHETVAAGNGDLFYQERIFPAGNQIQNRTDILGKKPNLGTVLPLKPYVCENVFLFLLFSLPSVKFDLFYREF